MLDDVLLLNYTTSRSDLKLTTVWALLLNTLRMNEGTHTCSPHLLLGALRILMGWTMLWAFLDKVFGLGFTTAAEKSWLDGVSPTLGFLKFATKGPFDGLFQAMAGNAVVDWLFMLGLLLIGLAMIVGIGVRIAGWSGAVLMLLMWLAVLPPEHNPVIDEHVIQLVVFLLLAVKCSGHTLGLGKWWTQTALVKKYPVLR